MSEIFSNQTTAMEVDMGSIPDTAYVTICLFCFGTCPRHCPRKKRMFVFTTVVFNDSLFLIWLLLPGYLNYFLRFTISSRSFFRFTIFWDSDWISSSIRLEFLQIKKMNIQAKPSEMRFNSIEAELKFRANEIAQPIKTKDTDVLKSSFVTEKVSTEQICDDFIARLKMRDAIPEEIKVSSDSTVLGEK